MVINCLFLDVWLKFLWVFCGSVCKVIVIYKIVYINVFNEVLENY